MTEWKVWCCAVIAAIAFAGIYRLLAPDKQFQNVLSKSLAAFFAVLLMMPFLHFSKESFSFSKSVAAVSESNFINETIINACSASVKSQLEQALQEKHYDFQRIEMKMNIDDTQNIIINEIKVFGVKAAQRQKVHDYIKKNFDLEVTIVHD